MFCLQRLLLLSVVFLLVSLFCITSPHGLCLSICVVRGSDEKEHLTAGVAVVKKKAVAEKEKDKDD